MTSAAHALPENHRPSSKTIRIKLKNSDKHVLVDEQVFVWLREDSYLSAMRFVENLRMHSSGCAVFQKTRKVAKGMYETETIYLHKLIAERFLKEGRDAGNCLAGLKSGDKLDCRLGNITWRNRAEASRLRKSTGKSGFIGVYQESRRFRAVISHGGKAIHIGMFDSAEDAARAYNKFSIELFGPEAKLNKI